MVLSGFHNSTKRVAPLGLEHIQIVEWSDTVVRARDDTVCATIDYVLHLKAEAVRLEKQAKKTDNEMCSSSSYTAHLGFVLWQGGK